MVMTMIRVAGVKCMNGVAGWMVLAMIIACAAALTGHADERVRSGAVNFQRDIRPIISDRCFSCHGPDESKSDLRLDSENALLQGGKGGSVINRDNPRSSEILRRIFSDDPDEVMPPPELKKPLTDLEKDQLRRWVLEGAPYEDHWAFRSPSQPAIPEVQDADNWCRNPIDHFILNKLHEEGMTPSPEADRSILARRLSLDLTGLLPPGGELLEDFAKGSDEVSFAAYVDGLLSLETYGERWARAWLDLARYADTNGYEKDRPRTIWPYRDWVIRAFNSNMPFDQFTVAQLAGDMLPGATTDDRIATGFHRNTMVNEEGGIDVAEFRYHSIVDRVKTTGATWLGLTLSCAQCHSHKYDPISQEDYFRIFAIFDNADEPELHVPDPDEAARLTQIRERIQSLQQSRQSALGDKLEPLFRKWVADESARSAPWVVPDSLTLHSERGATLRVLEDKSVLAEGDKPNKDVYTVEVVPGQGSWKALRLEVIPHPDLPFDGPGRAHFFNDGDFFLSEVIVRRADGTIVPIKMALASHEKGGRPISNTLDGKRDTGWQVGNRSAARNTAVFILDQPMDLAESEKVTIILDQHFIHQVTIGRFRLSLTESLPEQPAALSYGHEVESALLKAASDLNPADREVLMDAFLSQCPDLESINKDIRKLSEQLWNRTTTLVMQERPESEKRQTRLRHRGEFLQPRDVIEPGVPAALVWEGMESVPDDRLSFARWLFEPGHPLTARVFVNRTWSRIFGKGLVTTVEDFGLQGSMPTHPELLDWLAIEFQNRGWDIKWLHRLIVTSATYRQSAVHRPEYSQTDPRNFRYHRADRIRLPAEMIRDIALQSSGLLVQQIGGEGVFPPQDSAVTRLAYGSPQYRPSQGGQKYRRGLYTYWKRTAPYASFMTFDAPSADMVCTRRERSNTPLQSLVLLNDPVYFEAASAMAIEILSQSSLAPDMEASAGELAQSIFQRTLARDPKDDEIDLVRSFIIRLGVGIDSGDIGLAPMPEHEMPVGISRRQWTIALSLCRAIMNLDEAVTRP